MIHLQAAEADVLQSMPHELLSRLSVRADTDRLEIVGQLNRQQLLTFEKELLRLNLDYGDHIIIQASVELDDESLPLEEFMTIVYIYLFLTGAGLIQAVELVQGSFIVLPPGVLAMGDLQMWAIPVFELFKKAFVMAFLICAPVIVVLILTELCVAVVAAFTPNVQFYSMQFGLKCLIGLLILLLIFEFMNDAVSQMIRQNLEWISGFLAEVSR